MQEGRSQLHRQPAPVDSAPLRCALPVDGAPLRCALPAPREGDSLGGLVSLRRGDGSPLVLSGTRTHIMGIINLTPDSFSDGGLILGAPGERRDGTAALRRAQELIADGADLLDLGAESTRPGAVPVGPEDEWRRLEPALRAICGAGLQAVISVDTRHPEVAGAAAELGVRLLNLPFPRELLGHAELLRRFDGVVLMHSRGTPQTMTGLTRYEGDLCAAVAAELLDTEHALLGPSAGALPAVLLDPGLGFAKEGPQSLHLLGQLARLGALVRRPLVVGASRKSFLGRATGLPVAERLIPSVTAALLAAQQGAQVVRVHDVAQTRHALLLWEAVRAAGGPQRGGAPSTGGSAC